MRQSTKHAIAQRLVALLGFLMFIGPIWQLPLLRNLPPFAIFLGLGILFFGLISATGLGPWGRRFTALYIAEHHADIGRK